MVMPNRHDGASSPEWWDDLPPGVKQRVSRPTSSDRPDHADRGVDREEQDHPVYRPAILAELSPIAIFFVLTSIVIVLFLLLTLSFLFASDA
ncbi:MAG TPA: hypothetical protein VLM40_08680 [Gemmata sp.]|nr:hypothetical protein [Gemmata sp.]